MLLEKLFSHTQTVYSLPSISMLLNDTSPATFANRLNYYVQAGRLCNPRKGIYAKPQYNPLELANIIYTPSYVSLEYVLQRAGVIFQYDSTITMVSYLSRTIEADGHAISYRRIKPTLLADTIGIQMVNHVAMATPERAFLDMLYLNARCQFDNLNALSIREINRLLPIYNSKTINDRVKQLFYESK